MVCRNTATFETQGEAALSESHCVTAFPQNARFLCIIVLDSSCADHNYFLCQTSEL